MDTNGPALPGARVGKGAQSAGEMAENSAMRSYGGMDVFRVVAALLVVAIHTYPLTSISGEADFAFTHILGRVGVPFFLMATGYYLFADQVVRRQEKPGKLRRFLRKSALLYGIAILMYAPLQWYKGYDEAAGMPLALALLRDVLFDGTFYHLWYLPAAMLGAIIVWLLLKRLSARAAFGITLALYVIALLGDSYYGIVEQVPLLKASYDELFQWFDYTRNGVFFAPIYLLLGGMLAEKQRSLSKRASTIGLLVSTVLLLAEGELLHHLGSPRHDSMYIMLLPVMYFLWMRLLLWNGSGSKRLRDTSMVLYIVHPLCIVAVRGIAKLTGLSWLLVGNSVVHYAAVVGLSCLLAAGWNRRLLLLAMVRSMLDKAPSSNERAWLEINMDHLRHNAQELKKVLPSSCSLMAVVKANAYGHGDVEVAKALNRIGVHAFAVATASEGVQLRRGGVKGDILILGYTELHAVHDLHRYNLIQTVVDGEYAKRLNRCGKRIRVHIKLDTGMHRLGVKHGDMEELKLIYACQQLSIEGVYTHLATSDSREEGERVFTEEQIRRFYDTVTKLKALGLKVGRTHIQSSYGVLNYPTLRCDYARVGIALYGVHSRLEDRTELTVDLRPVLSLKARVAAVRELAAEETAGYSRAFKADRHMRLAVVTIGYADGIPRDMPCGQGTVLIRGRRARIVGKVCMDQLLVDVTNVEGVAQGDVVTVIGRDGLEEVTAEQLAASAGTITNELLSRLGSRLDRNILTFISDDYRVPTGYRNHPQRGYPKVQREDYGE